MKLYIKKSWLKSFFALFIGLIISLVIGEMLVRFFLPQKLYNRYNDIHPDFPWTKVKSPYGLVYSPNLSFYRYGENNYPVLFKTNAQGFRSDFDFNVSTSNKTRVAFFGDSYMIGLGSDQYETIPYFVGSLSNNSIEPLNFGMESFSFTQSFLMFFDKTPIYKPDMVVFTIFENDFGDQINVHLLSNTIPYYVIENGSMMLNSFPTVFNDTFIYKNKLFHEKDKYFGVDKLLMAYSHLYNLIELIIKNHQYKTDISIYGDDYLFFFYKVPETRYFEGVSSLICTQTRIIEDYAKSHNISTTFVYVPSSMEVNKEILKSTIARSIKSGINYDESGFDFSLLARFFQGCFEKNNLTYLNLYYEFLNQTEYDVSEFYNGGGTGHFSAEGTEFTAKKLLELWEKRGWI